MKLIIRGCLLLSFLISAPQLQAQEVREAAIKFAKVERPGLLADFPYSENIVEAALRARLERGGFDKPKSEKGFSLYKASNWLEVAPGQLDVYTKVSGKGNNSTVMLLVSKGYDNFVSATSDAMISERLRAFLASLLPDLQAAQLQADIAVQEEAVRRAERDYKNADDEGNKLVRERERIDQQLSSQASDKSKRADILKAEQNKLEEMKSRMK